jgi:hypothetical protein
VKPRRLYVPLDVGFARDPKLRRAGTAAELLFVRTLAYVKDAETDGVVPRDDLPAIGVRLRNLEESVAALVREGAWEEHPDGWRITAWHVWNEPMEAIDRRRQFARDRQSRKRQRDAVTRDTGRDVTRESRVRHAPQAEAEAEAEGTPRRVGDSADPDAPTGQLARVERMDVERVCKHLADAIEANGSKRPTVGKTWRDSARLLLDRDGRTEEQVHAAIDWCQRDEFWRANVLSMPKLRDKYDQMRLQANRERTSSRGRPSPDDKVRDVLALGERLAAGGAG